MMIMKDLFFTVIDRKEYSNSRIDAVVAIFLSLTPILQHYKGIYENAGATILIICFPYLVLKILYKRYIDISRLMVILPVIIFDVYKAVDHGITFRSAAHAILMIVIYVALANNCINTYFYLKSCFIIAELACVLIIFQYITYYMLGFHTQLVSINLLLPSCEQWFAGVKTGLISITGSRNGFYRPSAFFLEPSHFFLFVMPVFILTLMSNRCNKWKIKRAILFSVGLIFSTSGMAVVFVVAIWGLHLVFYSSELDKYQFRGKVSRIRLMLIILGLIGAIIIYFKVPFVHSALNRIFVGDQYGNTAISGRTHQAQLLLSQIRGSQFIFGVSRDASDIAFNFSGYAATQYKYGIIGVVLSYVLYVKGVVFTRRQFRMVSVFAFVVSFFSAHTHGTYHMMYYSWIIFEGLVTKNAELNMREGEDYK